MEGDKGAASVARRKLAAGIKHYIYRRPVCGIACYRQRKTTAPSYCLAIAAVFRVQQQLLLLVVEEAIRPPKIQALRGPIHGLRGTLRVFLCGKFVSPQHV